MRSGSMVASLIQRYEAKSEKSVMESPTASLNKKDNTEVTNSSPRSVISKTSSFISCDSSDIECSSLSNQLSADLSLSREDIWVSSLDLDKEDSELIEEQQDIGVLDTNFPSPSFNARSECENIRQEELIKLVFNSDMEEPIFWPFENESYKTSDIDKFLCVSPRRNMFDMDESIKSGLDPIRVRVNQKNGFKGTPVNNRKIVPNPEQKLRCTATQAQQILNMPSRLGRLSNAPDDLKCEKLYPIRSATERNFINPFKNLIQGGLRSFKESSIEKSIGLHEFDGHEGIEEHGADNEIPLCGSPWQITSMMKFGMQRIKRRPVGML